MDDLTLLDLLECPVCLEKLDVTAKVLPCQHTFCKPCLQRISKAHKGLRCPECRTLVFGSIEALPANLLLVRLLDGVRSGPGSGRGGSFRRPGVLALQDGRKSRTQPRGQPASPFRLVPNIRIHMDGGPAGKHTLPSISKVLLLGPGSTPNLLEVPFQMNIADRKVPEEQNECFLTSPYKSKAAPGERIVHPSAGKAQRKAQSLVPRAKALCNYRGQNPGDLRFNKGDVILLRRQVDENWYQGEINGISGFFPVSSVEVIKQLPQPPPLCRALYNFDLRNKDKSDNQDCLTFLKDDIITVISRVDENWAEGKLGDKIGIFPILFVEPNLTARHLLEKNKGRQPSRTKSLSLVSSSSRGKATNTPSLRRGPGSRRKGPGQLSITTALNTLNRMVHSPSERHMVEISTPMLISSSNPSVIGQHVEKADVLPGSLGQVSMYHATPASPGHSMAIVSLPGSQQHLSANIKTSSFPDSRSPGLYATWTLSTSSVSSQGSISEDGSLQRPIPSGIPTLVVGSLRRSPTMVVRPQQFQFHQPQAVSSSPLMVVAEMGPKPAPPGEPALTCISRGSETRIHSTASSIIMEGKEIPIKSEPPLKPPASAPPSILVKPENSRNSSEKQVKTVRFQNYSPPPTKHSTSGKPEHPATHKGSQPEAAPSGPEMTILFAHRSGCHSGQQTDPRRKSAFSKTVPPVSTASATQTTFPSK
ncbi:E3 ubiquitin-protein ligase SH3RF2 isoform X12 [Pipistrellus kuhlii]|uniref:E3 ubiquitin-protein ligase SH3RF2 isoform X12 n=1 Tax=Pipistrellus kuhlii TaxID=59472 RepID=UPI001E2700B2|nr:E3 ubiquitin-protein ligase SH3RF2 isoform X12 [Pipistrellus kuhlii]